MEIDTKQLPTVKNGVRTLLQIKDVIFTFT